MYKLIFCISAVFVISCKSNDTVVNTVDSSKIKKIKTVLILGNSIVRHSPRPEVGWYGDWGMAATCADSDFVHILIHDIHQKDSSVTIRFSNIAEFETNFRRYSLSRLDSFRNPDMLILRISENVDDKKAVDSNFTMYYNQLISYLEPNKKTVNVIVDGFWQKEHVNKMIKEYALKNRYPFLTTTDLSSDSTNKAGKLFQNPGVAIHPSDKGMRLIAGRIWAYIGVYF